MNYCINKN